MMRASAMGMPCFSASIQVLGPSFGQRLLNRHRLRLLRLSLGKASQTSKEESPARYVRQVSRASAEHRCFPGKAMHLDIRARGFDFHTSSRHYPPACELRLLARSKSRPVNM
jgi:hypothetical protein